jgi:hypothetical protein
MRITVPGVSAPTALAPGGVVPFKIGELVDGVACICMHRLPTGPPLHPLAPTDILG